MPPTAGDRPANPDILIVEAWGQGFMVGSLVLMIAITVANMKSGVLLHKVIVAEVCLWSSTWPDHAVWPLTDMRRQ
jgi:hypothetical protein